ncbi:ead/Ea22-like family protein [Phytobacter diazotrophicus]|uniref:ead/Ea22-like family protein n=1 Tax=Phytobacter diazotrophicus TaxID=395631 RepID=UPI0013ED08E4|nr:ead/Ea22-like family protein [Phytobacter diazotrophicus]QIH65045.1 hypothetical protein CRX67_19245 [Enterobacteriaceae bacterium A-F18]
MTINSEQIQALKARYAEPETPNCRICGAKMSIQRAGGGSIVYGCDGRVEGDGYAFKEGRDFADKHYEQSRETVYNMGDADVMALLAAHEADKALIAEQAKTNAFLKDQLAQLANFNPDWDMLEAARDSLREHMAELTEANKRISELESQRQMAFMACNRWADKFREVEAKLEARTVTVKLPEGYKPHVQKGGTQSTSYRAVMSGKGPWIHRDMLIEACAAAGITLVVGE